MVEFSSYYLKFIQSVWTNFVTFLSGFFGSIWKWLWTDVGGYFNQMAESSKDFDAFGWICLILTVALNLVLVFFLIYRLVQHIRRWIIYRNKEVEKDQLVEQIAKLKNQVDDQIKEKNRIFAMKFDGVTDLLHERPTKVGEVNEKNDAGQKADIVVTNSSAPVVANTVTALGVGNNGTSLEDTAKSIGGRFSKLAIIDQKYIDEPVATVMPADDTISLGAICDRFLNYAASQLKLYYNIDTVRQFFAGMGTNKVIILEGISGTGKTSLPYAMGKFFKHNTEIVSVQPSWRDRADLVGYLNEFTKKFNETDFLKTVYEANYRDDLSFLILDEMNLARIEYYFAEFLSIMEMPDKNEWKIDLVPSAQDNDPEKLVDGKLLVPQNIWFIGTANQDDSTFTITDKVYDRAVSLSLNKKGAYFDAPLTEPMSCSYDYLDSLYEKALMTYSISETNLNNIAIIDDFIFRKFKVTFGNRIMKQIKTFVPIYMACGGEEVDAIDFMLQSKVFRKFASLNLPFLVKELEELVTKLDKLFGKNKCPRSIEYLKGLLKNI